jgi:hypothetical protein
MCNGLLAQGSAVGAALNATLQLHISDSELKQPLPSECVVLHHFYDPQQRAHAPASESEPAFAHVERADYRYASADSRRDEHILTPSFARTSRHRFRSLYLQSAYID